MKEINEETFTYADYTHSHYTHVKIEINKNMNYSCV